MSFLNISIRLQQELEKSFNQEACKVLLALAEEIYNANSSTAQKIFDDNREILVLNIVERMREVFVTREEFDAKIGQLRSEIQAEFAKVRQEMAEMKQELKEDITDLKIKGMYWLVITGVVVITTIIGANYAMMTFFLEHLSK